MINENDISRLEGEEVTSGELTLDNGESLGENMPCENSADSLMSDESDGYSEEYLDGDTEDKLREDIRDEAILDMNDDLEELKRQFPELASLSTTDELQNKEKYLRFRSLGLSPAEAYMALGGGRVRETPRPASPLSVKRRDEGIPERQLRMARELFSEMSDTEIQALYRRVTK